MKKINTNGQRCSYNLNLKEYSLLVCILFVISLSSCSDNPVTPEPPPPSAEIIDSNFFDWEYFDVFGTNLSGPVYAIDTNDILMIGYPFSVRFRDRKIELTNLGDPDFDPRALNGFNNTVYIGGRSLSKGNLKLKKLEGNVFTDIEIPFDTVSKIISYIYSYADNDIWFATPKKYIYRYHHNELFKYQIEDDSRVGGSMVILNASGQLTAISAILVYTNPPNFSIIYVYKKFQNDKWVEIGRENVNSSSEFSKINGISADGRALRLGINDNIYIYNDNTHWIEYINTFGFFESGYPNFAMGNYDNNVLMTGVSKKFEFYLYPIIYYHNEQLYFQSNHKYPYSARIIEDVNYRFGRYSLVFSSPTLFESKFSIGIPKNKQNQNEKNHSYRGITLFE